MKRRSLVTLRPLVTAIVVLLAGFILTSAAPPAGPAMTSRGALLTLVRDALVNSVVTRMSVDELVGQMFMVSLENGPAASGSISGPGGLSDASVALVNEIRPGGVLLFGDNFISVTQVTGLVGALQSVSPVPLIIATDHEGGNVSRLTGSPDMHATVMPSETLVGFAADILIHRGEPEAATDLVRRWALAIGSELRALGVTMNLAPVADVDNPVQSGVLARQRRTFGSDPALVAVLVAAAVEGLHEAGVTAVVKHFPGQGSAVEDSHDGRVSLDIPRSRLEEVDLLPFEAGIAAGARAVMTAHIAYPAITGTHEPATTSPQVINGMLRGELGFQGVVFTDALNMDAVSAGRDALDLALAAIKAGADVLLEPVEPAGLHRALVDAVNSGIVSRERIEESVRRIIGLKLDTGLLWPGATWTDPNAAAILGSAEHQMVVDEIRAIARAGRG